MRIASVLLLLVLVSPSGAASRTQCDFRHANDCARRELGAQGVVVPTILHTVVGMVPPDSATQAAATPSTRVEGCRTITTDPTAGTFAVTLQDCPAGEATVDGQISGTAGVQFVGSVTGESGCAPILSGAPFGTTCAVYTEVTTVADVAATLTETSGDTLQVACSSGPGTGIDAIVTVDVVVTKVAADTPDARCFDVPGFCVVFNAEPRSIALTGSCTSRSTVGGRMARKSVPVALTGFQFVLASPTEFICATGGEIAITPSPRVSIDAGFSGDCFTRPQVTRGRRRHRTLPQLGPLF